MEGIVVIDKPSGITSHDVVDRIRKIFHMRRVGHAGTLDPLATGVLVILLGKSTKLFEKFVGFDKAYRATMILGMTTDSSDIQGKLLSQIPSDHVTKDVIEKVCSEFVGQIEQVPPMVSAVKYKGKKLYQLARKGITVERKPRQIRIDQLTIESIKDKEVQFYLECSKGTYVRQLAEDIGKKIECGACISQIQRLKVGPYNLEDAVKLEELNESHIRNWKG